MTIRDLGGTTVPTAVMRDNAIAFAEEKQHLGVPVVRGKRPAVVKYDRLGLLGAPILIENLDAILPSHLPHRLAPNVVRKTLLTLKRPGFVC
jgi:hypothetical protein